MWGEREYDRYDVRDTEVLVVFCVLDEKPMLLESGGGAPLLDAALRRPRSILVCLCDVDMTTTSPAISKNATS